MLPLVIPIIRFIPVNRAKGGVEPTPRRILLLKSINRAFDSGNGRGYRYLR